MKRKKYLVCVNLDGDLELWEWLDPNKFHAHPLWLVICGESEGHDVVWDFMVNGIEKDPSWWGREILGEL